MLVRETNIRANLMIRFYLKKKKKKLSQIIIHEPNNNSILISKIKHPNTP
jgi:hypothetical protein